MNLLQQIGRRADNLFFWPLKLLFPRFDTWSAARRRFAHNLYLGLIVEILILLNGLWGDGNQSPKEDIFLDAMMQWRADVADSDSDAKGITQIFLDVDEETWRMPAWGKGEPNTPPLKDIASLLRKAAELPARYIIVDFAIEGREDEEQKAFVADMEKTLTQNRNSRFLFARTFRRPLDPLTVKTLRPSFAVDTLMARYPDRVYAVAPNFLAAPNGVLRHWRLWESACYPLTGERGQLGEGRWTVVPSPQLLIEALQSNSTIPWALTFNPQDGAPTPTLSCAGDPMSPPTKETRGTALEIQRAGHSARMADYQAGKWVQEHFQTCYQQDLYTRASCKSAGPPEEQLQGDAGPSVRGNRLANRIVFYHSDLVRKHEAEQRQGRDPGIQKGKGTVVRVSAKYLLLDAQPGPGPAKEALKQYADSMNRGKIGVAIIGGSYDLGGDTHNTPLGQMPGAMVVANAVETMQTHGILQPLTGAADQLLIFFALVVFSAVLARFSGWWAFSLMTLLVWLFLGPLCLWLLKRGIWLNVAAPIGVIGLYQGVINKIFALHSVFGGENGRRKEEA